MRISGLALGALALLAAMPAGASEDKIADYGIYPALPCPVVTHPPGVSEAELLIICSQSYDNFNHATVYRTFNVKLRLSGPRAYAVGDPGGQEIDASAPVYDLSASHTQSVCGPISDYMQNAGKNCSEQDFAGTGMCYRKPAGNWVCVMGGSRTAVRDRVPPPHP